MKKEHHLTPLMDPYANGFPIDWNNVFPSRGPVCVEIGFGMGEALVREAANDPDKNFVGIECLWERVARTLKLIARQKVPLNNIRILKTDARAAFQYLFAERSIDHVYCLFPCPWPKKDHIKHRLFSEDFLKLVNSRLKDKGDLFIVTDFHPYCEWIEDQTRGSGFKAQTDIRPTQFGTKFERKWKQEGQEHFYEIRLQKRKAVVIPKWKAQEMKSYRIKGFNAEKFRFTDEKGEISVLFKDKLFDPKEQVLIVHLVVAEGHLTQHLRVGVFKDKKDWTVNVISGQNYFPTKGAFRALELTYQAALQTFS